MVLALIGWHMRRNPYL